MVIAQRYAQHRIGQPVLLHRVFVIDPSRIFVATGFLEIADVCVVDGLPEVALEAFLSGKSFPENLFGSIVILKRELDIAYPVERYDFVLSGLERSVVAVFLAVGNRLIMPDRGLVQNPKPPEIRTKLIQYVNDIERILQLFCQ